MNNVAIIPEEDMESDNIPSYTDTDNEENYLVPLYKNNPNLFDYYISLIY